MIQTNLLATPLVAYAVAPIFVILLALIIYRRLFHPLRSYPGPWINSVWQLPAALALARGRQHVYNRRLHEKYGPVVRVAPDELSFMGADALEDIYGLQPKGVPNMERGPIFIGSYPVENQEVGIDMAPNDIHARQRRALAPLFSNTALLQQQDILQRHVDKLVGALRKMIKEGRLVNFANWYTYTTFDMMGDLCFAEPFGCLDQGGSTEWSISVINVFQSATWIQAIRLMAGTDTWLEKLFVKLLIPKIAADWRDLHNKNSRQKTLERLENNEKDRDHPDFLYHFLQNEDSKKSLSHPEIILNMIVFISAGTETTASMLSGWTYFMCTHPNIYKRVVAEIRGTFKSDREITWETVKDQLPYLEATINESLRLYNPACGNQQRRVPPQGATIDGNYVPPGYYVAFASWAATHSPLNFHDPETFRPERWLPEENKEFSSDKMHASTPFSTGPRACIGKNLSYFEIRLILTHLLWNFDMELASDGRNQPWGTLDGVLNPPQLSRHLKSLICGLNLRRSSN